MTLIKDSAIVLRRLDYSETSQVLSMFTREHGQQRLIAKGVKRSTKTRVAVGIDLLELGRVVFSIRPGKEDNLATLTEWRQEDNFAYLRRDLSRCYAAQYAAEVTSHLTETHDPHPGLFDGLRDMLLALKEQDALPTLATFLWVMLTEIGLRPDMSRCMSCNRSVSAGDALYFSARQGGTICRDCEPAVVEKRRIADGVAQVLATKAWHKTALVGPVFDLLDYHITEIMARRPRLSKILRAVIDQHA